MRSSAAARAFFGVSLLAAILAGCGGDTINVDDLVGDGAPSADASVQDAMTRTNLPDANAADGANGSGDDASTGDAGDDDGARDAASDGSTGAADAASDAASGTDAATDAGMDAAIDAGCTTAAQCPATGTTCLTAICTNGVCGTTDATLGTACTDHNGAICDGNGSCAPMDGPGSVCTTNQECSSGACSTHCCSASCTTGGTCGATACDATGACTYPTTTTSCGTAACVNAMLTTYDCTGTGTCGTTGTTAACAGNLICGSATACLTGCGTEDAIGDAKCTTGHYCDGANGGSCKAPQANGATCTRNVECATSTCTNGVCVVAVSCTNGVKDGKETGTDCGGGVCPACAIGGGCSQNSDCTTNSCANGVCAASCTDGVKDGTETGTDCGGSCTTKCAIGVGCTGNGDCATASCVNSVCAASCTDGTKDGNETGTDCGGGTCASCGIGGGCTQGSDCTTASCVNNVCAASCTDGTKDGNETGTDCGGVTCATCGIGGGCTQGSDCATASCVNNVCAASCTDMVQDGTETGIDCGGSCTACASGGGCGTNADCASANCVAGKCVDSNVVIVAAGSAGTGGAELHPTTSGNGTWSATTAMGDVSTNGLGIAFLAGGARPEAIAVMHSTGGSDNLEYATWTPASFAQWAAVGAGITTRQVPTIDTFGGTAYVSFQGTDFKKYVDSFDGTTWGGVDNGIDNQNGGPTPAGIAALASGITVSWFNGNNDPNAQDRVNGTWNTPVLLSQDKSYVATPTIVRMNGGTADVLDVWIRQSDGALMSTARTAGTWATPQAIAGATGYTTTNFGSVEQVALAALPSGGAIAAWRDGATGGIFYATYGAGAWSTPAAFATPNVAPPSAPALAHGAVGATAEMAYVDTDGVAYHSRLIKGAWSTPVAAVSGGGGYVGAAIAVSP